MAEKDYAEYYANRDRPVSAAEARAGDEEIREARNYASERWLASDDPNAADNWSTDYLNYKRR